MTRAEHSRTQWNEEEQTEKRLGDKLQCSGNLLKSHSILKRWWWLQSEFGYCKSFKAVANSWKAEKIMQELEVSSHECDTVAVSKHSNQWNFYAFTTFLLLVICFLWLLKRSSHSSSKRAERRMQKMSILCRPDRPRDTFNRRVNSIEQQNSHRRVDKTTWNCCVNAPRHIAI